MWPCTWEYVNRWCRLHYIYVTMSIFFRFANTTTDFSRDIQNALIGWIVRISTIGDCGWSVIVAKTSQIILIAEKTWTKLWIIWDPMLLFSCRDLESGGGHASVRRQRHWPVLWETERQHGQPPRTHQQPGQAVLRHQTGNERGHSRWVPVLCDLDSDLVVYVVAGTSSHMIIRSISPLLRSSTFY